MIEQKKKQKIVVIKKFLSNQSITEAGPRRLPGMKMMKKKVKQQMKLLRCGLFGRKLLEFLMLLPAQFHLILLFLSHFPSYNPISLILALGLSKQVNL
jgi:hypothetical protein